MFRILGEIELIVEQERRLNKYRDVTVYVKNCTNKTNFQNYNSYRIILLRNINYKHNLQNIYYFMHKY